MLVRLFAATCIAALAAHGQSGQIRSLTVPAPSLAQNLLGDSASQTASIYLPPEYDMNTRRYPVLYVLHGFSLHPTLPDWTGLIREVMDQFSAAHPGKAFIVVAPNGYNAVNGSFYEDSPVAGNWETFISKDLVSYIDSTFRTLAAPQSRAIAGHSMGGFGAMRLLMRHSDVFRVGYAMSPCCLDFVGDLTSENAAWQTVLGFRSLDDIQKAAHAGKFWETALGALAIAVTPNRKAPALADYPYTIRGGRIVEEPDVVARWRNAMPMQMAGHYSAELRKANGIGLDYGLEDPFSHIRISTPRFGQRLMELGAAVALTSYHGDHNDGVPGRFQNTVVPFVADRLQFAARKD